MVAKNDRAVLVVEDDLDLLGLIETVLEEEGYEVMAATDGKEALDKIAVQMPGLILLDMRMPIMDGWEFSARFRKAYDKAAPIIVLTAAEDARARAAEIEAEGYIGKPFDLDDLLKRVKQYVHSDGNNPEGGSQEFDSV
ncbi:MAG: response regulator [Chloroflexi bacterium]|nr:response regulator [Chloroflexota bacterium]